MNTLFPQIQTWLGLIHPLAAEMNVAATYFSNLAECVLKNATQMTDQTDVQKFPLFKAFSHFKLIT